MTHKDDIEAVAEIVAKIREDLGAKDCAFDYAVSQAVYSTLRARGWRKCAPPDDTFKQHDHEHHT